MSNPQLVSILTSKQKGQEARELLAAQDANELIFAIVGHVGSGTSEMAKTLKSLLEGTTLPGGAYDTVIIKASELITEWATKNRFQFLLHRTI